MPAARRCFASVEALDGEDRGRLQSSVESEGYVGVVEDVARQPGAGRAAPSIRVGAARVGISVRRRVGIALVDDHRVDQPGVERGDAGRRRRPAERLP